MPVINVQGVEIVAQAQQLTSPSIHISNSAGEIYHVALIPVDGGIYDASETLVYEESAFNTCQQVTLTAGIYRAEMRGGTGGRPYNCGSGMGKQRFKGDVVSTIFKLNEETTVSVLRGGDGNNSAKVSASQISGGGASGVDSLLVIGSRVVRATGGVGTRCITGSVSGISGGGYALFNSCYGGGGGIYPDASINNGSPTKYQARAYCAGGGGGSNDAGGGKGSANNSSYPSYIKGGAVGTSSGGGDGGNAIDKNGNAETSNTGYGGAGGTNVSYSCGGATATSYGGGGGGGMCFFVVQANCTASNIWCKEDCVNGGDGGTGSTGTSSDSYVKIYKIG